MESRYLHTVVIDGNSHRVLMADSEAYYYMEEDLFLPIENHVLKEDRDAFLKRLKDGTPDWFESRLVIKGEVVPFFFQIDVVKTGLNITLHMIKAEELMENLSMASHELETYRGIAALNDDLIFEYDPVKDEVMLISTAGCEFLRGPYTLEEFKEILKKRVDKEDTALREYFAKLQSGMGRFSARVRSNLLNDDPDIQTTVLRGAEVFHNAGTETIVGTIHTSKNKSSDSGTLQYDSLTGLLAKAEITRIAMERINVNKDEGTVVGILDVDFFKDVNDTYGHQMGDVVIRRIAGFIQSEVGFKGEVGRIGGDEFMVVLNDIDNEEQLRVILKNVKNLVRSAFPNFMTKNGRPISLSIGTARYPTDADNYDDIFRLADYCLYVAKAKGRNRYVMYNPRLHESLDIIRNRGEVQDGQVSERGLVTPGEVLVDIFQSAIHGVKQDLRRLCRPMEECFHVDLLTVLAMKPGSTPKNVYLNCKKKLPVEDAKEIMERNVLDSFELLGNCGDTIVVNQIKTLPKIREDAARLLNDGNISSFVMHRRRCANGGQLFLALAMIGETVLWNEQHTKYYETFLYILERCGYADGSC